MKHLSNKIEELVNYRIVEEEKSNRLYLAMSKWCTFKGYEGASKLFKAYADEETEHANWAYKYLEDKDYLPKVQALPEVQTEFKDLPEVLKLAYEHEVTISEQCNELTKSCLEEGDFMTMQLGNKFMEEQIDEEAKTTYWLDRLDAFGTSPEALRLLDNEMFNYED